MESYVVIANTVTGIDQRENGNIINYRNRTIQTFQYYADAVALAKREQRNLRAVTKANDPNYDALYICKKDRGGMKIVFIKFLLPKVLILTDIINISITETIACKISIISTK